MPNPELPAPAHNIRNPFARVNTDGGASRFS